MLHQCILPASVAITVLGFRNSLACNLVVLRSKIIVCRKLWWKFHNWFGQYELTTLIKVKLRILASVLNDKTCCFSIAMQAYFCSQAAKSQSFFLFLRMCLNVVSGHNIPCVYANTTCHKSIQYLFWYYLICMLISTFHSQTLYIIQIAGRFELLS